MRPIGLWLTALGVALLLEGLPYFVAPSMVRRTLKELLNLSDGTLRALGFMLMALGLLLAWAATRIWR